MPIDSTGDREMLARARDRCRRLIEDLRRDAEELGRPSRLVAPEVLAEGRAAHDRAAASAGELLRRLERSLSDEPDTDHAP